MTKKLNPDPGIEALIRRLNAEAQTDEAGAKSGPPEERQEPSRWSLPDADPDGLAWLERLLVKARRKEATDLLLVAGAPPVARLGGHLRKVDDRPLSGAATELLCAALVPADRREQVSVGGSVDFAVRQPDCGNLRCNVHRERGQWAAAIRLLPEAPPDLEALNLPSTIDRFTDLEYGLVLVTGPTGSGKSTTLAALIRRILSKRKIHLVTIEDPVEYEHAHQGSVVEHIEIGRDVGSFAQALRSVLRQDPDVLLIGEMRDPESMSIAITAAETGHLVLSTLHTGDTPQTIHRILDSYPARQQEAVRTQLSVSLAGIVSQQLLPRADGPGRVPAAEVLVATRAVRNLIRKGKIEQIRSQLTLERNAGMLDLDRSLASLVGRGLVEGSEARARARAPEEFETLVDQARS